MGLCKGEGRVLDAWSGSGLREDPGVRGVCLQSSNRLQSSDLQDAVLHTQLCPSLSSRNSRRDTEQLVCYVLNRACSTASGQGVFYCNRLSEHGWRHVLDIASGQKALLELQPRSKPVELQPVDKPIPTHMQPI